MNTLFLFIGGLGGWEVLLIVGLVVLMFGAKKIPELAKGLGTGLREFKSATREQPEEEETIQPEDTRTAPEHAIK